MTRSFVVIRIAALTVALVLAGMTLTYSYFTAVAAETSKCAGRALLEDGYRTGVADIWGLPLGSVVSAVMLAALGRGKKIKYILNVYDLPIFEFASMRITLGMSAIYGTVFVALAMAGFCAAVSAARYNAIAKYCLAATAVTPSKAIATIPPMRIAQIGDVTLSDVSKQAHRCRR